MENVCVSLDKALELQAANYPVPEMGAGQYYWINYAAFGGEVGWTLGLSILKKGKITIHEIGLSGDFKGWVSVRKYVYAPAPSELMRKLGGGTVFFLVVGQAGRVQMLDCRSKVGVLLSFLKIFSGLFLPARCIYFRWGEKGFGGLGRGVVPLSVPWTRTLVSNTSIKKAL